MKITKFKATLVEHNKIHPDNRYDGAGTPTFCEIALTALSM
jgi:hypothetical protein